jgi:cobalt/nickel transport system permease protein
MTASARILPDLISRADPRLKILMLVLWSFLLAFLQSQKAAAAGLGCSAAVYLFSGHRPLWAGLKTVLSINFFLLFLWLLLPFSFSVPGEVIGRLGIFEVTREGLALTVLLSLKALAITLGALAVTGSAQVYDLLAGARKLGVPEKLTALVLLMMRYISVIGRQYRRLRQAMKIRGFQPGTNLHTLRTYANLAGLLLVRGLDRAERVQAAMLCRGYTGRFWIRTDFQYSGRDVLTAYVFLALALLVMVADVR